MADTLDDTHRRAGRRGYLWWLVLAALLAGGYWYFSRGADTPPQGRPGGPMAGMMAMPVPVRLAQAQVEPIQQVFDAVGTVTARQTVSVRSRVDGLLEAVYFDDGQAVQAGAVLAQIDPRPFQVRLDQARGQLLQVQAQLENARQDLKRFQTLFRQNSIARQQLDTQLALVAQLEGQVVAGQATVDEAALELEFTKITAPISGRLGIGQLDAGNMIRSSDAEGLVVITRTQPIDVMFSLPQSQLQAVRDPWRDGQVLKVDLYGRDNAQWLASGTLQAVDNQIDVATGTVRVKAAVENEDEQLFPNQFVNVRLQVAQREQLVVPVNAVQYGSVGAFVYHVGDDDTVSIQTVETGWVEGRRIAVLKGLQAGDRVVVEGTDRLREGAKVRVVQDTPQAAGDAATATPPSRPAGRSAAPAGH